MTAKLARKLLLVGVSAAALAVSAAEAGAKIFLFTGSVQTYLVPETGEYEIPVAGAQGGSSSDGNAGGMGAIVGGDIFLRQNEVLSEAGDPAASPAMRAAAAAALSWVTITGSFSLLAGAAAADTETDPSLTGALAALKEAAATGEGATAAMADRVGMAAKAAKTQSASMAAAAVA